MSATAPTRSADDSSLPEGRRGVAVDAALLTIAFALTLAGLSSDEIAPRDVDGLGIALAAIMVLAVLLRRVSPEAMLIVGAATWLTLSLAGYPSVLPFVPLAGLFSLAERGAGAPFSALTHPGRNFRALLTVAALLALLLPSVEPGGQPQVEIELHIAYVLLGAIAWLAGDRMRSSRRNAGRERDRVLADERSRLARELHDAVGHAVNTIGLSAGSARLNFDAEPERARAAILSIEETARRTAAEMDTLLGEIGSGELPGLDGIAALLESQRAAGRVIEADVRPPPDVDPAVGRAVYRIVQEGLTNALRHAPDSPVRLQVGGDDGDVSVHLANRAPGPLVPGRGITGMADRARRAGGELTVTVQDGEVVVRGRLPVRGPR